MFKQIMKSDGYWRSVVRLAFLFMLVLSIIEHFGTYKGFDFEAYKTDLINRGMLARYALGGIIYGLIISFVFQRKKIIQSRKK